MLAGKHGWWLLLPFAIMWFLSGWVATVIERKFYETDANIEVIIVAVEDVADTITSFEERKKNLARLVPSWWFKLMSRSWQEKLVWSIQARAEERPIPPSAD